MPNSEVESEPTYAQVNDRLKEIVEAVEDENLPLDDALGLFEEAVKLGMQASTLLEQDIAERDAQAAADDGQLGATDSGDSDGIAVSGIEDRTAVDTQQL